MELKMKKLWQSSKWLIIAMVILIVLLIVLLVKRDELNANKNDFPVSDTKIAIAKEM